MVCVRGTADGYSTMQLLLLPIHNIILLLYLHALRNNMLFNRNGHNRANMIVIHVYTYSIVYLLYIIIDRYYYNTNALLYNISDTRRFFAVLCSDFKMIKDQLISVYIYIYLHRYLWGIVSLSTTHIYLFSRVLIIMFV